MKTLGIAALAMLLVSPLRGDGDNADTLYSKLAGEIGPAVRFTGSAVEVRDKDCCRREFGGWCQRVQGIPFGAPCAMPVREVLARATLARVLLGIGRELGQEERCRDLRAVLAGIRRDFRTKDGGRHPLIEEISVQAEALARGESGRKVRIDAARRGCVTSMRLVQAELDWNTDLPAYFGGLERTYSYAMLETMFAARAGTEIRLKADAMPQVGVLVHKANLSLAVEADNLNGASEVESVANAALLDAVAAWNTRFVSAGEWELDLHVFWKSLMDVAPGH